MDGENEEPSATAESHNINPSAMVSKARENNDRTSAAFRVESQQLKLFRTADTHNKTSSATVERAMVKGSDTQPKENQKHKSERKRKSKPELIRNGGGQKRRSVRNGGQGNDRTFRRRTKNHPQWRKKTRQRPPQRREIQMNQLSIHNGFKGI